MKYHLVTLGCPKNAVDSEGMDGILADAGHTPVATAAEAELIIVNTCSFIAAARAESLAVLHALGEAKHAGQQIIAAGCMAASHGPELAAIPGVNHLLSTQQWMQIGTLVGERTTSSGTQVPVLSLKPAPKGYADWRTAQIRRTAQTPSAYLKIGDGCNLHCAFCTIPSFKGTLASKPIGAVLAEAQELVALGVREIVLVAQHLTDYGRDLGLDDGLATLLDALCAVLPTHVWVRLMYAYPHGITERLIEVMATRPQICHYLDMPLQHAHPATLRRMHRPADTARTLSLIGTLRAAMPDLTLRSTFIVGFPGETTEEYRALLAFLEAAQLDRVGAFRFSPEPGTHAASLPDQVRPHVLEKRWHELMQLQRRISNTRTGHWLGRTLLVLIEGHGTAAGRPVAVGRSFRDAPEVDGQVFVWGQPPVGTMLPVHVTRTTDYDLWGEVAEPIADSR